MSEPRLDQSVLSSLKEVMEDDFPLLVETFLSDSQDRIRLLREAIATEQAPDVRNAAHSFKGSCSNMGALALAGLCKQLEECGRTAKLEPAPLLLQAIEQEFAAVSQVFAQG
ncbi:Hpt domain-containing protein [Atopomonas sediminilitoris]|uniref:Hpt domain-containing protein n=1 Tax=Atopomonas sediminilitoris TaxID=2919919 RepID=UPI001F4E15E5|nr:Hpt domain-containing protein [Atopomonas sediminilitoris]MCJ8167945.1 Hpt domain-containing protein [Atopomonas sediminilitoris]